MPLSDEYTLGTGLLENENVWFQQATFSYDADYNKGQSLCLVVQVACEDGRTEKVLLPVGDGWEAAPGGMEIRREDGNNTRRVQKQSAYGQFLQSVIDMAPANPGLLTHLEQHPEGPKHVAMWLGLGFHVIRKEEKYNINGQERITQRLLADSFLGVNGQAPAAAPVAPAPVAVAPPAPAPAAQAPAAVPLTPVAAPGVALTPPPPVTPPAAAPPAPVAAAQPVLQAAPEVVAQLRAIAKEAPDHSTWMTSAFSVPGVMGDSALEAAIIDQSAGGLFLSLRAS